MKGKWTYIILLIFFLIVVLENNAFTQEKLMPVLPEIDSTQIKLEKELLYQQLLSGTLYAGGIIENLELQGFNFNNELAKRYQFNPISFQSNSYQFNYFPEGNPVFSSMPFVRNSAVFSEANYRLNDKFMIGGYSFGANSVFSAPYPNNGLNNNFDSRGSTFFIQYKVSKNFKIETRVSVTQGQGPGF